MALSFLKNGKAYAALSCCVSETTLKFCVERRLSDCDVRRVLLGPWVSEAGELAANDGTLRKEQWDFYSRKKKLPARKGGKATFDAIRLKRMRLRKNACTIAALHGRRGTRFITVTSRENYGDKKDFLYHLENLRKALAKRGWHIRYSGMIERQKRGAWHLHALAYFADGRDWDYGAIQRVAVNRGFNIDMQKLSKARRTAKKISRYMSKLDAVVIAAYQAKMESGEDYAYTLTSKGCDLPRHKRIFDMRKSREWLEGYGFERKAALVNGAEYVYYLLENEHFGREIYDSC
jgi:hypothetical protein